MNTFMWYPHQLLLVLKTGVKYTRVNIVSNNIFYAQRKLINDIVIHKNITDMSTNGFFKPKTIISCNDI